MNAPLKTTVVKCTKDHSLTYVTNQRWWRCDICDNSIAEAYGWRVCNYDICEGCNQNSLKSIITNTDQKVQPIRKNNYNFFKFIWYYY